MKSNTFSERLKYALDYREMKPAELSSRTGLSQSLISQYLSNKFEAKNDKIYIIAKELNVSSTWLLGFSDDMFENIIPENITIELKNIPIFSPLSCGTGLFVDDQVIDYVAIPESKLRRDMEYFGQFAIGSSMINAGIIDSDILIFERCSSLDSGQIGCFCIDENIVTCKKFKKTENSIILLPSNDDYDPIIIDIENSCFRIVGKLAFVVSDRR